MKLQQSPNWMEKEAALEGWILEREAALIALSKSPYRLEQLSALTGQAGIKFDPKVVDSFLNLVM